MKITDQHKFHFYVKEEARREFIDIKMISYLEIPQSPNESSFKRIEDIRLFYHEKMEEYECGTFQIDFGRNDCMGAYTGVKTAADLTAIETSDTSIRGKRKVSRDEYLKLREKVFEIYLKHPKADWDILTIGKEITL